MGQFTEDVLCKDVFINFKEEHFKLINQKSIKKGAVISHFDLDGTGGAIMTSLAMHVDSKHIYFCGYDNVNQTALNVFNLIEKGELDFCVFTDISVSEQVAERAEMLSSRGYAIALLDHHPTATSLNRYKWAIVYDGTGVNNGKMCGTSMAFEAFRGIIFRAYKKNLTPLSEYIRLYDTWEWNNDPDALQSQEALNYNDLHHIYGQKEFYNKVMAHIVNTNGSEPLFNEADKALIAAFDKKKKNYIYKKLRTLAPDIRTDMNGNKFIILFAEEHVNDLSTAVHKKYPELDYVAIIMDGWKVSLRRRHGEVDLGEFAKQFGGGGHAPAAGFELSTTFKDDFNEMIDHAFHGKYNK